MSNPNYSKLIAGLASKSEEVEGPIIDSLSRSKRKVEGPIVNLINSAWADPLYAFKPSSGRVLKSVFHVQTKSLDFKTRYSLSVSNKYICIYLFVYYIIYLI